MKRTTTTSALAALVIGSTLSLLSTTPAGATAQPVITGRASVRADGSQATLGNSFSPVVSGDGRFIAFTSSSHLVSTDTDAVDDAYLKDTLTGAVERLSVPLTGSAPTGDSRASAITPDGRFVVFRSAASNLVAGDTNSRVDVFVRDRQDGTTERVSVNSAEQQGDAASPAPSPVDGKEDISNDGRYVAFASLSTNLGPDANATSDVFVRDRTAGTTELVSTSSAEVAGNQASVEPAIDGDGSIVAFSSEATNLVVNDTNSARDVFVRNRGVGTTARVSLTDADGQAGGASTDAGIDDSGLSVVFTSAAPSLATGDTDTQPDVFVRNRSALTTTLVSRTPTSSEPNAGSDEPVISGDASAVAFHSEATNLGPTSPGGQVFVRRAGVTDLASSSTAGAPSAGSSRDAAISDDGLVVAWDAVASNLVTGDTNSADDVFFRRSIDVTPFATTGSFVAHQLSSFAPTAGAAGYDAAVAAIESGTSPEHQAITLATAPAFAAKRAPLIRLYTAYFKRFPDKGGFDYWLKKLANGTKLDQVSAKFATSSEFKTKYGNTTNTQFVTLVFNNVLDRDPDAGGLAFWVKKLDGGMSRGTVMTNFSESSEGKRHFSPQVHTGLLGLGLLGTFPTGALRTAMTDAVTTDSPELAARVILHSAEYAAAVV